MLYKESSCEIASYFFTIDISISFYFFESLFLSSLAHANQQTLGSDQISKDIYLVIFFLHLQNWIKTA